MKSLFFLANPSSPHVRQWVEMLSHEYRITIFHIHDTKSARLINDSVHCVCPLPEWLRRFPSIVQYAALGMVIRILYRSLDLLHAHNASGYGMAAWLSGRPYIVTTYGTEVYSAASRSAFYRFLIRRILAGAATITATSSEMRKVVSELVPKAEVKVATFSLGVARIFLAAPICDRPAKPVRWIVNRRIHPLYDTLRLVKAFKAYLQEGGEGELILIEGDSDPLYLEEILRASGDCASITCIRGFIDQTRLMQELDKAHFCISVPASDQLSSSILEGMARGAVPILRDLSAYDCVKSSAITIPEDDSFESAMTEVFRVTGALELAELCFMSRRAMDHVASEFSMEAALNRYRQVLARL